MPHASKLRIWSFIHTWTSLVCTAFLLLLYLTGLPLIFAHEIDKWLEGEPPLAKLPLDAPRVSLDRVLEQSRKIYPGEWVTGLSLDQDQPTVLVGMKPSVDADERAIHWIKFDARTAQVL